ncbi:Uncharacterised protein [Mycobacteroides abscessus subsp. abscessus]|nr:Uncharacterised protein [Mycobacteroides abscessus subsp. abscessus]
MLAARGAVGLGKLVRLGTVDATLGREEQDPVVGGAHEEVLDDVVLLEPGTLHTLAATPLAAVQVGLRALGIPGLGDGDDDVFARDEILVGDVAVCRDDLRSTLVAELLDDHLEFVAHDGALTLRLLEDVLEIGDLELDLGQLVDDLLALECRQTTQLHRKNGVGLDLVDVEETDEALSRRVGVGRRTDQCDHFVKCVKGFHETAQNVRALFGLAQPVPRTTHDDVDLVRDVVADHLV